MNVDDLGAAARRLIERSPDAHLLVGADGTVVHANPSAQAALAADDGTIAGTTLDQWIPKLAAHPGDPPLETEMTSATGDRFPAELALVPADDGPSGRFWIVFHDITARRGLEGTVRRHAEELETLVRVRSRELDDLRARYRGLYDLAPVLDFELDSQGAIASANRKACFALGVSIDRLIGVPLAELAVPEQRNDLTTALGLMREGPPTPCETRLRGKDGVAIDVAFHPLRADPVGRGGLRLVGLDVTARREAERQVDQSLDLAEAQRARMERILRGIGEGIVVTDPDGQVRMMNPEAERILGVEERYAFGRDLLAEQIDVEFVRRWSTFTMGDAERVEAELSARGPGDRVHEAVFSRIRTREGRPAACAVTFRDVTAERRAAAETRRLFADLVAELRGPVASLRRQLVARLAKGAYVNLSAFAPALSEAERLARLVDDLVLFARLEAVREPPAPRPGNAEALLAEVVSAVEPVAAGRGVTLTVRGEGGDPDVLFDPDRLRRVLELLLRRAISLAPTGGCVDVDVGQRGAHAEIVVRGTAGGIAAEALLDRTLTPPPFRAAAVGAALELHLARRLLAYQSGELHTEGAGLSVRLLLPRVEVASLVPAAAPGPDSFDDVLVDDPDEAPPASDRFGRPGR